MSKCAYYYLLFDINIVVIIRSTYITKINNNYVPIGLILSVYT